MVQRSASTTKTDAPNEEKSSELLPSVAGMSAFISGGSETEVTLDLGAGLLPLRRGINFGGSAHFWSIFSAGKHQIVCKIWLLIFSNGIACRNVKYSKKKLRE